MAFHVDDSAGIYQKAISRGATSVMQPTTLKDDDGFIIISSVKTYGDTTHTFVQRDSYKGIFMPGFIKHPLEEPINKLLPLTNLSHIDHCVGNQPDGEMEAAASWYEKMLDFHRFWSVDDKMIHTNYSSLRSIVVADFDENVKMPINEPANGMRKSQIQEYCDYYQGAGVQHIAMRTEDIVTTVERMKARGVEFLDKIPDSYYDRLIVGIEKAGLEVKEDIEILRKLKILVDYDEKGYLL